MPVVTNQPIQLSYFVRDISTALATYNRLRWHRSRDGSDGIYEAVTQGLPTAAVLDSVLKEPHQLNGKELKLKVDGASEIALTVVATDPVSTADLVSEILAATSLVIPSDASGLLRLTSVTTGTNSSIEVQDGDANPFLGFAEGDGAVGLGQDTILLPGVHEYLLTDQNSDGGYWYRVEFLHSVTGATSGLGVPFPADSADSVAKAQTIVAYLRLADMGGKALEGRRVFLHNTFRPNKVDGFGVFRHTVEMVTDRNGYAEVRLVRGMDLDLSIDGSGFVRRLTIPTTGDSVDLLDPSLVTRDEFGIQEANIDFAIRTS
jgi:hypothetical protein